MRMMKELPHPVVSPACLRIFMSSGTCTHGMDFVWKRKFLTTLKKWIGKLANSVLLGELPIYILAANARHCAAAHGAEENCIAHNVADIASYAPPDFFSSSQKITDYINTYRDMCVTSGRIERSDQYNTLKSSLFKFPTHVTVLGLSLIHIWRCRRSTLCRSRWSPYH